MPVRKDETLDAQGPRGKVPTLSGARKRNGGEAMSTVPNMEVVPGAEEKPRPTAESTYYATPAGLFCRERIPGHTPPVQLTNFDARISEDVIVDDGAGTSREFVIEATVNGRRGPVT